jgi:hypothetical protein
MKTSVLAALGVAMIGTLGASSAAQAAVIDFGLTALGGTLTYAGGATLDKASSLDLDGSTLIVSEVGADDSSKLSVFPGGTSNTVKIMPTDLMFGSGSGVVDMGLGTESFTKMWTAGGDTFTETFDTVHSIDRMTLNAISVVFTGHISDTGDIFNDDPVTLIIQANQAKGATGVVSASLTNTSSTPIPEPSTWVMMGLGFAALGYAASRGRKTTIAMLSA